MSMTWNKASLFNATLDNGVWVVFKNMIYLHSITEHDRSYLSSHSCILVKYSRFGTGWSSLSFFHRMQGVIPLKCYTTWPDEIPRSDAGNTDMFYTKVHSIYSDCRTWRIGSNFRSPLDPSNDRRRIIILHSQPAPPETKYSLSWLMWFPLGQCKHRQLYLPMLPDWVKGDQLNRPCEHVPIASKLPRQEDNVKHTLYLNWIVNHVVKNRSLYDTYGLVLPRDWCWSAL